MVFINVPGLRRVLHSVSVAEESYEVNLNGRGDRFGADLHLPENLFRRRNASGKRLAFPFFVIGGDGGGSNYIYTKNRNLS